MKRILIFRGPVEVEKDDGAILRLDLNGQTVDIIFIGGNICKCRPIGFF